MLMQIFNKMKDMVFILLVTGFFSWIANIININPPLASSAVGCLVLVALAAVGIFISLLPGFIMHHTNNVSFLALTTPLLAYAGLSIGKDMEAFKGLSWRIIPVALAVAAGSFVCSTILAEFMLHLEGVF